ncbi:MAG: hypothetical protein KDD47_11560 [Acidobacteria bacterium]|nr:hypothetical protein [Acidobacteriota bacterium]
MFEWIRQGLRSSRQNQRLVLALYLASFLPALLWAAVAFPVLSGALADRPFADGLLGPESFQVWVEFAASNGQSLAPLFGLLPVLLGLTLLVQVMVSAGAMHALWGEGGKGAFFDGVRRFTGRFLRSLLALLPMLLPVLMVVGIGARVGSRLAESTGSGNLRLGFLAGALAIAFLLFVAFDLAHDLSRISAVAWNGRQTFRGYFRALWAVLKRPGSLVGTYVCFVLLLGLVILIYQQLRGSFAAASTAGILGAVLLQQGSMLVRAFLQLSLLGGEVAAFHGLEAPDSCRGRLPEVPATVPVEEPSADVSPVEPAQPEIEGELDEESATAGSWTGGADDEEGEDRDPDSEE